VAQPENLTSKRRPTRLLPEQIRAIAGFAASKEDATTPYWNVRAVTCGT
jgi:hypothetical protein